MQVELKVISGKQQGKVIPLTMKKFLVGREKDCHLRPRSDLVSRHHCVLTIDDYAVRIRDLGSTNGTIVNSQMIQGDVVLSDGDEVVVGKLVFQVCISPSSPNMQQSTPPGVAASAQPPSSTLATSDGSIHAAAELNPPTGNEQTAVYRGDTVFLPGSSDQPQPVQQPLPPVQQPLPPVQQPLPPVQQPLPVPPQPMQPMQALQQPIPSFQQPMPAQQPVQGAPQQPVQFVQPPSQRYSQPVDAVPQSTIPEVILPPPEETGVQAPKPVNGTSPEKPATEDQPVDPRVAAAEIFKQYTQRPPV